ncbi:LamG-like jellyroll fold domain-containing protein [uncultured Methanolobus sp.]|uniref:LamG-like jellyroll fold domain-containing protein n=1 Tax=uncultured Methanolobus sp. TaxID=218300 RepID=UPI0029C8145A|nr:LamG-like jellyroll fold domain-containing protein [uncultured Methanolobus sp.]
MKDDITKSFISILLVIFAFFTLASICSAEINVVLQDGDARTFSDPPDVIAYANTEYSSSPLEFQITTSGTIWRYYQWIALMNSESWVEATTTVETDNLGMQFWGDDNDGWAQVLVDGSEVWIGDTYSPLDEPYVKYLKITGLTKGTHTIRVENMGLAGEGMGSDVTIYFFGLEGSSATSTTTTSTTTTSTTGSETTSSAGSDRGLVAYYPFDNSYKDFSTYNNHGTPKGSMDFTAGVVGNAAASFDGKSYIEVKDSDSLDLTDDFTFAVWLNKEDVGVGGWAVVFSKGDTSSISASSSPYALFHTNGIYPGVRVAGQIISSNAETKFNDWYFVTVTKEGSDLKFYVNGELRDTKKSAASIPASESDLLIGIDPPGVTEYFKGAMDELRIYNYALSQDEIRTIYGGETAPVSDVAFNGLIFESRSKAAGSTVQIPLTLHGVKENIGNMDITLEYDSSVLEAQEAMKGGLTQETIFDSNIIGKTIRISFASKDGFSGDGSVAYVRFAVIGEEESSSPLTIKDVAANRAEDMTTINIPTQDGIFTVISMGESLGDADGDGAYTARDALEALQMAVDKIPEDLILDMNSDGRVTSIDAKMILEMAVNSKE